MAATRIVNRLGVGGDIKERAAALTALTSFEFFDGLAENSKNERRARTIVLELARKMLNSAGGWRCRQSIHRPQIENGKSAYDKLFPRAGQHSGCVGDANHSYFLFGHDPPRTHKNALYLSERVGLYCQSINLDQPLPKTNRGSIVDERP
jgi:hypothetical protein